MRDLIVKNLAARFRAYDELLTDLDDAALQQRIDVPKHKNLLEHLWCVVGARESYAQAIEVGQWQGFACSMTQYSHADFSEALRSSAEAVTLAIDGVDDWNEPRQQLLATLSEHEVMHEGQIIRHMYALGKTLPDSWQWA